MIVAGVATAAITTTGSRETKVSARPARIRPAKRGAGPAGRVRVYGSQGCARSSATPMPYWKRLLLITAKVTIEAVAKVAATGSSPVNGTTKKSIETAGKKALPITAIGIRIVSRSWYLACTSASCMAVPPVRR